MFFWWGLWHTVLCSTPSQLIPFGCLLLHNEQFVTHLVMCNPEEGRMRNKKKSEWWKVELKEEKEIETEEERERVRDWGIFLGVSSLTTSVTRASCLRLLVSLCNPASKETPFSQPETGLTLSVCTTVRVPKDNFSLHYCYSIKGNSCIEATLLKIKFPV